MTTTPAKSTTLKSVSTTKRAPRKTLSVKSVTKNIEPTIALNNTMTLKPKVAGLTGGYISSVGRRKEAVARVRLYTKGTGKMTVNGRELAAYLPTFDQQLIAKQPLVLTGTDATMDVTIKISGGGTVSQSVAIRHGVARALLMHDENLRKVLRTAGFLTRDARVKERKKPGLKKARRAPQFSKR